MFTFDGPNGLSDIDVTATNSAAFAAFNFTWWISEEWGVSDHRLIHIKVSLQGLSIEDLGTNENLMRASMLNV